MINHHIIRMGTHAEKNYLLLARPWYGEVTLKANLVEGTGEASAALLLDLSRSGKPYCIDPVTYAFALSPTSISSVRKDGSTQMKKTFAELRNKYQIPSFTKDIRLSPDVFADPAVVDIFVQAVVEYQLNTISDRLADAASFLDTEDTVLLPSRVFPPYFDVTSDQRWLDINRQFVDRTVALRPDDTWGIICIDGRMMDDGEFLGRVGATYAQTGCQGFLLWMTAFDETEVTTSQIKGFQLLAKELAGPSLRPVVNMYGGYFSTLLSEHGVTGIAHGVGYGEKRALNPPVGGGLPPAKYYLRAIHDEISVADLAVIASQMTGNDEFLSSICSCMICVGLLNQGGIQGLVDAFSQTEPGRNFPTQNVYRLARFHFLSNRHTEIQLVNSTSLSVLRQQLVDAFNEFRQPLTANLTYMQRWAQAV